MFAWTETLSGLIQFQEIIKKMIPMHTAASADQTQACILYGLQTVAATLVYLYRYI